MGEIRRAAVAGTFYPADKEQLSSIIRSYLNEVPDCLKVPKAMILPHAGYIYSGAIAASGYKRLLSSCQDIKKVLLIGPSHRVAFSGLALSTADQFETPLGLISVDVNAVQQIAKLPFCRYSDQAHQFEHSLEVHLPFLQSVLDQFSVIPVVAGDATAEQLCQLIELFWKQADCLIVISSDLSHFHDYSTAQELDSKTTEWIEDKQFEKLNGQRACGYIPVSGLLAFARNHSLQVQTIDLRNSGDTAGSHDKDRVVGYGAYVIE